MVHYITTHNGPLHHHTQWSTTSPHTMVHYITTHNGPLHHHTQWSTTSPHTMVHYITTHNGPLHHHTQWSTTSPHTMVHYITTHNGPLHHHTQWSTTSPHTMVHYITTHNGPLHHHTQWSTTSPHTMIGIYTCMCTSNTSNPTIMQGFSVCLLANSSFSSHAINVKLSNPPQRYPWSVLRWLAFCLRSYFENSNGTVLSIVLGCHLFNDTFADKSLS